MLVCATLFWACNFMIGKFAFLTNIPPMSLVFFRWSLVWLILLPFTYKEIIKFKNTILSEEFFKISNLSWQLLDLLTKQVLSGKYIT